MNSQVLGGRYRTTQVLAQGGFGQTYLATDTHRPSHPTCVVKQLRPVNQKPELMPKIQLWFKNEGETLAKLGLHNQIPQLLAYFEEDGEFYLVQEYIPGQTLSYELVPGNPWDSEKVIHLLIDILEILEFVHSHGVIHRDIKPSNIIRRQTDNKLVLIDFGTVKQIPPLDSQGQPNLTLAVGTPAYMPVEQLYGYPQLNSDIYAVGIIGIQAASGLSAHEVKSLIDPHSPNSGIGSWRDRTSICQELADILEKMVVLDYRERYQTATVVISNLKNLNKNNSQNPETNSSTFVFAPALSPNTAPSNRSKTTLYKRRTLLSLLPIAGIVAVALSAAFYFFSKQDVKAGNLSVAKVLSGHSGSVWSVALSADAQTLASGSEDKKIKIWHPETGELNRTLNAHSDNVRTISLSADGQTLVSGSGDNTIKIWQPQTGKLLKTLTNHSEPVWSVVLSRDGQTLVSGSQDKTIKVWDVLSGKLIRTLVGHSAAVYSVALSPDSQTLVSGSQDKTVKVWDVQTGLLLRTIEGHTDAVRSVAISPDGQTIASGSWDQIIKIWNIRTGMLVRTLKGHSDRVVAVSFRFDGKTLASASVDNTVKIWDLQTGDLRQTLSGHSDWVLSIAMSSWGNTLITGSRDKTIKIWQ
ncbi:MAG: serine/threonine-protein kinase [Scytonema sp. PMC 1069.18]|nr:serine/threonine-protein kinase [Scytonema sp. PMC 1069.18]MEC4880386.1 serine/threonine-protein kinase [Scytonema sp. PMC 1070.18]